MKQISISKRQLNKKTVFKMMMTLLLALVLVVGLRVNVAASEFEQDYGSVSVDLVTSDGVVEEGATLNIYQVATVGGAGLEYTKGFEACEIPLSKLYKEETAKAFYDFAVNHEIDFDRMDSDADGNVTFEDLPLGLYLICQEGAVDGFDVIKPFLVTVPIKEDGAYIYDVDASPKVDVTSYLDLSVKKIWNDNGKDRPKFIKAVLKDGDEVIDEIELSDDNDWYYAWNKLPYSEEYFVEEIDIPKNYKATYSQEGNDFTITNTVSLVQTGQLKWPIPVLLCVGVLLLIIGMKLGAEKNEKERI